MTETTEPDPLYFHRCYCTGVTRAQVLRAITEQSCRTVEDLQITTRACTGCRTCRPELERLLSECQLTTARRGRRQE